MKKELKNTKRKNNKGFSLVELIVVIAIMAVLMAVLAPAMLRYVEKSREQKDRSAVAEVINAVNVALSDETVNSDATTTKTNNVTVATGATGIAGTATAVVNEVKLTIPSVTFTSKSYKDKTYTIQLVEGTNKVLTAEEYKEANWK